MIRKLDRRTLLRGAGGVAVALPYLDLMRPRAARAAKVPPRFLFWYTANGTISDAWESKMSGTEVQLNTIVKPMERHKKDLIALQGLEMSGGGYGHEESLVHQLVGRRYVLDKGGFRNASSGISLDQALAARFGKESKFPSLQIGVKVGANSKKNEGAVSFNATGDPISPQDNPYEVFRLLFGDMTSATGASFAKLQAARKSVLDSVLENAALLTKSLGAVDKAKLDQHMTSIREIEAKLDTPEAPGGRCAGPDLGTTMLDWNKNDNVPLVGKIQMDLMVSALSCNLTRFITFMFARAWGGGRSHTWIPGAAGDWHAVSHESDNGGTSAFEKLTKINTWYYEQLAYFVDKLKDVKEEGGSLLDNMVIFVGNEYGNNVGGESHVHKRMPYMLVGKCGGAFKTGQVRNYNGTKHNGILVAIQNALGVPDDTFGDPAFGKGPLPGILV